MKGLFYASLPLLLIAGLSPDPGARDSKDSYFEFEGPRKKADAPQKRDKTRLKKNDVKRSTSGGEKLDGKGGAAADPSRRGAREARPTKPEVRADTAPLNKPTNKPLNKPVTKNKARPIESSPPTTRAANTKETDAKTTPSSTAGPSTAAPSTAKPGGEEKGDRKFAWDNNGEKSDSAKGGPESRGFAKGAVLLAFSGGLTLGADGSYVKHEQRYDRAQRYRYLTNASYRQFFGLSLDLVPFEMTLSNRSIAQLDMEYGVGHSIGLGFSLFQFSIDSRRQDQRIGLASSGNTYVRQDYIDPFPVEERLYQGTGLVFQFVYHFMPNSSFDPYVAARLGPGGFSGRAHAHLDRDPFRNSTSINNGVALIGGAALGVNIHMNSRVGLRVEGSVYRQRLQAAQFSSRGLSSRHFLVGFFVNFGGAP